MSRTLTFVLLSTFIWVIACALWFWCGVNYGRDR